MERPPLGAGEFFQESLIRFACAVAVSPHDAGVILVGTIGDANQGYTTRLYKTVDGGTQWEVLRQGLPDVFSIADRGGSVAPSVVAGR